MSDRAIIEAANKMTGQHKIDQVTYVNAVVDSVDISKRTCACTAIDGHTQYDLPTVSLMASVDDGDLKIPVIGSTIKVIFSQNIEPFVCQYSELENIIIFASTKIQLQDGSFGGLVKVSDLVSKINTLESDLNTLKSAFNSWTVVPSDGGSALKIASATWVGNSITETKVDDLENTAITHGSN